MSDSAHVAQLRLKIQSDLKNFINEVAKANTELGYTDGLLSKVEKDAHKLGTALTGTGAAAGKTAKAVNDGATASKAATAANKTHTESLISQRYALYDVATTYGAISAAMLAAAGYTVKTGADFESAFSGVQRTTLDASGEMVANIDDIKASLIDLSTQIPVTFDEIAKIATLGAQMGIAADDLDSFSETVAQMSTVTGISVDQVAASFGVLSELLKVPASEFSNLGSSIALVGVNANATEAQILSVAEQIGSYTTLAGYSADETIGLAGALASLKVPPEQARSAFQELFTVLNKASASEAGLSAFGNEMGLTADAAKELYKQDPEQFVEKFARALSTLDAEQLTLTLENLGVDEKRIGTVLTKIAGSTALLTSTNKDAATGYQENIALAQQYAKVAEDLNSKFMVLVNSTNALISELSGGSVDGLAGMVQGLTDLVNGARELAGIPAVQQLSTIAITLTAIVGALVAFKAASALATASTYALLTAQAALSAGGATTGIVGLSKALFGVATGAGAAAAGTTAMIGPMTLAETKAANLTAKMNLLRGSLSLLALIAVESQIAGAITSGLSDATAQVSGLTAKMNNLEKVASSQGYGSAAAEEAAARHEVAIARMKDSLGGFLDFSNFVNDYLGGTALGFLAIPAQQIKSAEGKLKSYNKEKAAGAKANAEAQAAAAALHAEEAAAADEAARLKDEAAAAAAELAKAAEKVVTLKDYAADLAGVVGRAFEIRFSGGQGADAITSGWSAIAKATMEADKAIRDYRTTIQQLNADNAQLGADRKVLEYFAAVASRYGDGLATADLQARLAKNAAEQAKKQNELTDANKSLTDAQAANSKGLTGNSDSAIANRAQILGLVSSYQDYIAKLAASGMSQSDLAATSARLKGEFQAQAAQAGYSSAEIDAYSRAFDDMKVAIDNVPRNITVDANTDPAMQALAEFLAAAAASSADVPITSSGAGAAGALAGEEAAAAFGSTFNRALLGQSNGSAGQGLGFMLKTVGNGGGGGFGGGFADGGYTGDGGMYQPAGVVHKGEYVFSKAATQNLGVDKLARLHSVGRGSRGYANGGLVGGGSGGSGFGGPTDLSAGTIMAIAQAVSQINVNLYTDDRRIAESSNRGTMLLASGGSN